MDGLDKIFRSFFGFSNSNSKTPGPELFGPTPEQHSPEDDVDGDPRTGRDQGTFFFFGPPPPPPSFGQRPFGDMRDDDGDGDGDFGAGHGEGIFSGPPHGGGVPFGGRGPSDMFQHFDDMFRSFNEVFRSMGIAEFPHGPEVPAIEAPPGSSSLRDKMLKEPDAQPPASQPWQGESPPAPPQRRPQAPSFFGKMWSFPEWSREANAHERIDSDLDDEIVRGNLETIMSDRDQGRNYSSNLRISPQPPAPHRDRIKSISVRTVRGADGKVEERRTVQDGGGHQEETLRRTLGDQTYTVLTKRDQDGATEVTENFSNMDERDKEVFKQMWDSSDRLPRPGGISPRHDQMFHDDKENHNSSFFANLFGLGFPGFIGKKS